MASHGKLHNLADSGDHAPATLAELNTLISDEVIPSTTQLQTVSGDLIELSGELISSAIPAKTLYVALQGNDSTGNGSVSKPYRTIKAANDSVTDASTLNPYVIRVDGGVFVEEPINTKPYVFIQGNNQSGSCIQAMSGGVPFITLNTTTAVDNMTILGPLDAPAIYISGDSCAVRESSVRPFSGVGEAGQYGVYLSGGAARLVDCNFTNCNEGVYCGGDGLIRLFECDFRNCDTGLHSTQSGEINSRAAVLVDCPSGLITENQSTIKGDNVRLEDSIYGMISKDTSTIDGMAFNSDNPNITSIYDIWQQDTSRVDLGGGKFDVDKISISNPATFFVNLNSRKAGDEGHVFYEELQVGSPEAGRESVFGGGDSYTREMKIYRATTGTLIQENVALSATTVNDGLELPLFPNGLSGDAVYIASNITVNGETIIHPGLKYSLTTAPSAPTNESIQPYYYDSVLSGWSPFEFMVTESGASYYPIGQSFGTPDGNTNGSYQLRYDYNISKADTWGATTIGTGEASEPSRYWIRWTCEEDIYTVPVVDQIKLHTNRMEINDDGYVEYFGKARPYAPLGWSTRTILPKPSLADFSVIYDTADLTIAKTDNVLNTVGDTVEFDTVLPNNIDTSSPIRFRVALAFTSAQTPINYKITAGTVTTALNSTMDNKSVITGTTAIPGANSIVWIEEDIYISNGIARRENGFPDLLAIKFESNTGSADFGIVQIQGSYVKWCEGEHV